jgi:hypothetical protein
VLIARKSQWAWLTVVPAIWFTGMLFSHLVFGRCVLNEIVLRLVKLRLQKSTSTYVPEPRVKPKIKVDTIQDAV